jgi:type VI secretion system VasD/TssJ family lipoprotein
MLLWVFALLLITLPGTWHCGKKVLKVTLIGGLESNQGNAVDVRIYQLRNDSKFQLATVDAFWKGKNSDEEFLGKEFINKQEKKVRPKEQILLSLQIDVETQFIGVAANFFNPNKDKWRYCIPISKYKHKKVAIVLGENSLVITDVNAVNLEKK